MVHGYKSARQSRGHRFPPWSGKTPRAVGQLSPCATTTDPVLWGLNTTVRGHKEWLPHHNWRSPCSARKTQNSQK